MFSRKGKLKKEYDEQLARLMNDTKKEWHQAKELESLIDDYDLNVIVQRKIAESKHFYLFKEARTRKIKLSL
jgi:hypothetical protein